MNSRILAPEEWSKLEGTEASGLWPHLDPENTRALVVEEDGEIVAAWLLMRVVHAECLWVRPSHRGALSVARRLFRGMREIAMGWGARKVVTGSASPVVTDLIQRFGGEPMPCDSFVLPLEMTRRKVTSDLERGRAFHRQLATLVSEDLHPEDASHDERVGRAIRVAVDEQEPERAMADYNAWARSAGYEPIKFLGTFDGRLRADIVTAVVEMDANHVLSVVREERVCQPQP